MTDTNSTVTYPVTLYLPTSKPALPTDRLVVLNYKQTDEMTKAGKKKPPSYCVSIPKLTISVSPATLNAVLLKAAEEMQDDLIRSLIDVARAGMQTLPALFSINPSDITTEMVAAYQSQKTGNGHLSKDKLEAWFKIAVQEALEIALVTKKSDITQEQLSKVVSDYRSVISSLASPRANLSETLQNQIRKALDLVTDESDTTKASLLVKLDAFRVKTEVQLEELL